MGWMVWIARIRFHDLSFKLSEIEAARSILASLCSDSSKRPYYAVVMKIIVRAVSTMNNTIKRQYPDLFKNKNKTKQNEQTTTKRYKQTNKKQQLTERQKLITPFENVNLKKKKNILFKLQMICIRKKSMTWVPELFDNWG